MNRQCAFSLVEASAADVPVRAFAARPNTSASLPPISPDIADEYVIGKTLEAAKDNIADALRSQEPERIQAAQELLIMVAVERASWTSTEWHRFFINKARLYR